jgi:hypothetical protein
VHRLRDSIKHLALRADDGASWLGPLEGRGVLIPGSEVGSEMAAERFLGREVVEKEGLLASASTTTAHASTILRWGVSSTQTPSSRPLATLRASIATHTC